MITETKLASLLDLLHSSKNEPYIGEPVSQLEHALQAAELAARAGSSDALIASALLHDVGHICAARELPRMPGLGVFDHERVGAEHLRAIGFGEEVLSPIENHVRAKRYLVTRHPGYRDKLSAASVATLELQGGPLSESECDAFEQMSQFREALRLRAWDEQAKVTGFRVPSLDSYVAMLERLLVGS